MKVLQLHAVKHESDRNLFTGRNAFKLFCLVNFMLECLMWDQMSDHVCCSATNEKKYKPIRQVIKICTTDPLLAQTNFVLVMF